MSVEEESAAAGHRPQIVVLGNEKGGSGKSTAALHLIVALLRRGFRVASMDLDARQGTLSRALENRQAYMDQRGISLPMPDHERIYRSEADVRAEAEAEEDSRFAVALERWWENDYVVIDTPGSDTYLSRIAHTHADLLLTPLNDSYLDLDLLARIDVDARKILGPSIYSQMVWEQRQRRAMARGRPIDWVVLRNRLSHIDARSKRDIERLLGELSQRVGFRMISGFGERVIFRELFPKGLTLLDLREKGVDQRMTMSHVAARQEVRALLEGLGLPEGSDNSDDKFGPKAHDEAGSAAISALPL